MHVVMVIGGGMGSLNRITKKYGMAMAWMLIKKYDIEISQGLIRPNQKNNC
jgi:hypothetical protein